MHHIKTNQRIKILGKNADKYGVTPAVALCNPKYDHNIGAAIRAASCYDINQVWYSGNRIQIEEGKRIPREERMKGYNKVELIQFDNFFDQFNNVTPVAIELTPSSENLSTFEHPENPLYVFGPEDGSIPKVLLRHCHRFVFIPTKHCVNLAAAVYTVLYDRKLKRIWDDKEPVPTIDACLAENRGFIT